MDLSHRVVVKSSENTEGRVDFDCLRGRRGGLRHGNVKINEIKWKKVWKKNGASAPFWSILVHSKLLMICT